MCIRDRCAAAPAPRHKGLAALCTSAPAKLASTAGTVFASFTGSAVSYTHLDVYKRQVIDFTHISYSLTASHFIMVKIFCYGAEPCQFI